MDRPFLHPAWRNLPPATTLKFVGAVLVLTAVGALPIARGQTTTWTGNGAGDFWSDDANWTSGRPANNGNAGINFSTTSPRLTPDMDSDYALGRIMFSPGAAAYTLGSSGSHTLTVGGIQNGSTNTQTLNMAMSLGSDSRFIGINQGANLIFDGPIATNGYELFLTPATAADQGIQINNVVSGGGSIVTNQNADVTNDTNATVRGLLGFGGRNTYTGLTTIGRFESVTLTGPDGALAGTTAIRVGFGSSLALGDGNDANSDRLNDAAHVALEAGTLDVRAGRGASVAETIGQLSLVSGSNTLTLESGGLINTAALTTTAPLARAAGATALVRAFSLGDTFFGQQALLGAAPNLVGGGGAAGSTNISIVPYLIGGTAPTDTGSTFVTYGTSGLRTLDTGTEFAQSFGAATSASDNVLISAAESLPGNKTVNSLLVTNNAAVTIPTGATLAVTSGAILLQGDASAAGSINGGTLAFGSREGIVTAANGTTAGALISSAITGTGGLTVNGTTADSDYVLLTGQNTYTGTTYLNTTLFVSGSSPLGASGPGNDTVINPGGQLVLYHGATVNDNLVAAPSGNFRLASLFAFGTNNVLNGSFTPADVSTSVGNLTNILNINLPETGSALTINGGISSAGTGADFVVSTALNGNSVLTFNGPLSGSSDARFTLSVGLRSYGQTAANSVILNGANDYSGATLVFGGTLLVNNTSGSGTGQSTVRVESGGRIGGTGTIGASRFGDAMTVAGGRIAPGDPLSNDPADVLTINGDLEIQANSGLEFELGAQVADQIDLFGSLRLTGTNIAVDLFDLGGVVPGTYVLLDYSGTLTGPFGDLVLGDLPTGWEATLINNTLNGSVDLQLTAVPEPGAWAAVVALLTLAAAAQGVRRATVRSRMFINT